jgi:hypothetical protein
MNMKQFTDELFILSENLAHDISMAEKVCNTHVSNQVISIELYILRVRTIIRALVDLHTRALSTIILPNSTAINRRRYAYACTAHAEAEGIPMVVDSNETEDEYFVTDIGTFDNNAPTVRKYEL